MDAWRLYVGRLKAKKLLELFAEVKEIEGACGDETKIFMVSVEIVGVPYISQYFTKKFV